MAESKSKNPTAIIIGQRIKQARLMANYDTQAKLLERIPQWGPSRLGNYEAGHSIPSPDDIFILAEATGSSPCWIMFGIGPIRASGRDTQAIRHQNLEACVKGIKTQSQKMQKFLQDIGLSPKKLNQHLDNPFLDIGDRIARRIEKSFKKPKGWMDEQHVESDPICASFPDDMKRIMTIFSNLDANQRKLFTEIALAFERSNEK